MYNNRNLFPPGISHPPGMNQPMNHPPGINPPGMNHQPMNHPPGINPPGINNHQIIYPNHESSITSGIDNIF